ncbi:MAG: hypothetical protein KDA47_16370, partial [Planctomycetales bacterium]|nr:hypothetical protein [Planctomycetales bacterium]
MNLPTPNAFNRGALDSNEVAALRAAHYNATLMASIDVTDSLRILRVRPDKAIGGYEAGQYTSLGLGYWEA